MIPNDTKFYYMILLYINEHSLIPIGQVSEKVAEARNKYFRFSWKNYSKKFCKEKCNLYDQ